MDAFGCIAFIFIVLVIIAIISAMAERKKISEMAPKEREGYLAMKRAEQSRQFARQIAATKDSFSSMKHGKINPSMICPHCQSEGKIRTKPVDRKKGISGGKATGALLTGGFSILATGLSRKERLTQAHCENCGNTWDF